MKIMSKKTNNPKTAFEWEIVKLVKKKRDEGGISQAKIANALDVSSGYVGQIEMKSNSSMYKYDQLNKIAILLNCSPKDFIPESVLVE